MTRQVNHQVLRPGLQTDRPFWAEILRFSRMRLENIPAEVCVFGDVGQTLVDVLFIDADRFAFAIRRVKADVFHELFHDRGQSSGANVVRRLVHAVRRIREGHDRVLGELDDNPFGGE